MKQILKFIRKNITYVVFGILFLILLGYITYQNNEISELSQQNESSEILIDALNDTITTYKDKNGDLVSTKRTLQLDIDKLNNINDNLSDSQNKLLNKINNLSDENELISAAYIGIKAQLDSLLISGEGNVTINNDSSVTFNHKSDSLLFIGTVNDIIVGKKRPSFMIDKLEIPNEQFITFYWSNKDKYYQKPVKFSITNSNPLMKTNNIESYIIPEVNQNLIKPTNWQKIKNFVNDEKNRIVVYALFLGGGYLLGAGL